MPACTDWSAASPRSTPSGRSVLPTWTSPWIPARLADLCSCLLTPLEMHWSAAEHRGHAISSYRSACPPLLSCGRMLRQCIGGGVVRRDRRRWRHRHCVDRVHDPRVRGAGRLDRPTRGWTCDRRPNCSLSRLGPAPRYVGPMPADPRHYSAPMSAVKHQPPRRPRRDPLGDRPASTSAWTVWTRQVTAPRSPPRSMSLCQAPCLPPGPLDFVLFFSSLTGFLKAAGPCHYCGWLYRVPGRLRPSADAGWTTTDVRPALKS